jgi:beta-catenin-like protein 1
MHPDNQDQFLQLEGFELMMRCLHEQQYAAGCVMNVVNFAVAKHTACCERFVDVGGLKYLFPILVGKGLKKALKRKGSGEQRELEQSAISIISQLCTQLSLSSNPDYQARLVLKLLENTFEKVFFVCELYDKYFKVLEATDARLDGVRRRLMAEGDRDALTEFLDEDNMYFQVN